MTKPSEEHVEEFHRVLLDAMEKFSKIGHVHKDHKRNVNILRRAVRRIVYGPPKNYIKRKTK